MLMKCVGEAKLGGARGAGLDSGSKTKRFGEAGKTSRELQLDVWLGNNVNTSGQGSRDKRPREDIKCLGEKRKCSSLCHRALLHNPESGDTVCVHGVMELQDTSGTVWCFGQEGVEKE